MTFASTQEGIPITACVSKNYDPPLAWRKGE